MMYELKKFIFNKRNVGVFGFLVFFLVCFIGYNVYMDKHYNESQIKIYQKAYRISENRMDEAGSEEESEFWKKVYRNASGLIHFYYNSENKTDEFIESKLSWNHLMLQANNEGYIINDFEKRDVQTLQNETKQLKYLKNNHIEMLNSPYEPNTFNIFNELFNQKLYLVVMLILCILLCDIFGLEMESGFYKNLYVSRISKQKILLNKMKFSLFVAVFLIIVMFLIIVLSGLIFGIGNCDYPYFYFDQMYTVKEIVAKSIILLVVESVFVVGISALLFTFSLNNGFILAVNLILYALFFVLGNVTGYSRFFVYIPFLHIDFVNLIIHKQVVLAAIISLMYFLSCSLISLQCFKKREVVR